MLTIFLDAMKVNDFQPKVRVSLCHRQCKAVVFKYTFIAFWVYAKLTFLTQRLNRGVKFVAGHFGNRRLAHQLCTFRVIRRSLWGASKKLIVNRQAVEWYDSSLF